MSEPEDIDNQAFRDLLIFLKKNRFIKNMKDLAVKLDYNYTYLSQIKNDKHPFSLDIRNKILDKFELSLDILRVKKPEYIIKSSENSLPYVKESSSIPLGDNLDHFKTKNNEFRSLSGLIAMKVPIVPMDAYAQYVDEFYEEANDITFEYGWVEVDSYGKGNYLQFRIKGDSMNGGLIDDTPEEAVVLAREIGQHLWTGGLYKSKYGHIIITNKNILFKDITGFNKKTGYITLHSRNKSPEYSDFDLRLGECEDETYVRQIFKVIKRNNM